MSDQTVRQLEWKSRYMTKLNEGNLLYELNDLRTRKTMMAGKTQMKLCSEKEDEV